MKSLNVYINFGGNCKEALEFYKDCMNGEITSLQTYGDSPMETNEATKDRVMHAEFKAEGVHLMVSDGMPGMPINGGNQVNLSLNLDNKEEQDEIFKKLAVGGNVTMPLADQFWGARFGMLTDKYGINWMLNCHANVEGDKKYV